MEGKFFVCSVTVMKIKLLTFVHEHYRFGTTASKYSTIIGVNRIEQFQHL